jgi:hypothetical protein
VVVLAASDVALVSTVSGLSCSVVVSSLTSSLVSSFSSFFSSSLAGAAGAASVVTGVFDFLLFFVNSSVKRPKGEEGRPTSFFSSFFSSSFLSSSLDSKKIFY